VRLPLGLSAESGPLHLWPTQKGIADALADPAIERVTLVGSPSRLCKGDGLRCSEAHATA